MKKLTKAQNKRFDGEFGISKNSCNEPSCQILEICMHETVSVVKQHLSDELARQTKETLKEIMKLNKKLYDPIELGIRLEDKIEKL